MKEDLGFGTDLEVLLGVFSYGSVFGLVVRVSSYIVGTCSISVGVCFISPCFGFYVSLGLEKY